MIMRIINVLVLMAATAWLTRAPDWEPLIALLLAIAALAYQEHRAVKRQQGVLPATQWQTQKATSLGTQPEIMGNWYYALVDDQEKRKYYGCFRVRQVTPETFQLYEGRAWIVGPPDFERAEWHSTLAGWDGRFLRCIYSVTSLARDPELGPKNFESVLRLAVFGNPPNELRGQFYDLGERHEHWGKMLAKSTVEINVNDLPMLAGPLLGELTRDWRKESPRE